MITEELPPKIQNAYWFQAFNAVSWQLCLGSPLILFANALGAPAVVLGLLAGLAPLTSVLQLVVAPSAERIGYRNLMVRGWSARVATLIFLTLLPIAALWLPATVSIALLVLIMTAFTTLRGIATCAWLPWITAIVPRPVRGFYLSRDRTYVSFASVAALALAGIVLLSDAGLAEYAIVFGISFLGGATSLYFLNRIPVPVVESSEQRPSVKLPWLSLLGDGPFTSLLIFSATAQVFVLSTSAFVTVFVRDQVGISAGAILWLIAGASLLGVLSLRLMRDRIDRLGSRPFLGLVFLWWVIYFGLWWLMAANLVTNAWLVAPLLLLAAGFFAAIYDISLTRLLMNTVGERPGMTQYFAFQSVIVSLLAGISPIMWGYLLDSLDNFELTIGGITLDGYAPLLGYNGCCSQLF
ncbi:MAG: MFS transporter [Anaerolineales bacterium]|nr:MFS transporter [Anaerolineales bacterium]